MNLFACLIFDELLIAAKVKALLSLGLQSQTIHNPLSGSEHVLALFATLGTQCVVHI